MQRNRAKLKQAPLAPLPLIGPGFLGLNTERATTAGFESPNWALTLRNTVFGDSGMLEQRKGYSVQTGTPMTNTPAVWRLHEYRRQDSSTELIGVSHRAGPTVEFWRSLDDGGTWASITGTVSSTTVRWKFVNFGDICYAGASGHKLHFFDGSGNLTEIASSPVCNGTITVAFGRIWIGVDGTSEVSYSGLANGQDWTGPGAGALDLDLVWTLGLDQVVALAAFGATFVVFGREHIIIYVDGTGSVLGIDPENMYVVDTVEGTGALSPDAIVSIGEGDLWFLSPQGVQSLGRVVADKVNPLTAVTDNVRTLVKRLVLDNDAALGNVQAIYSPGDQFALFLFQEEQTVLLIDTRPVGEGVYRCATWAGLPFKSLCRRKDGTLWFGLEGGEVAKYDTFRDDGVIFDMVYASPWMNGGDELHNRLKIVKQFYAVLYGRETVRCVAHWGFDYRPLQYTETMENDYLAEGGEYGIGEYGIDEYGTGHRMRRQYVGGMGDGLLVQLQLAIRSLDVDAKVAVQEVGMHAKIGRAG